MVNEAGLVSVVEINTCQGSAFVALYDLIQKLIWSLVDEVT